MPGSDELVRRAADFLSLAERGPREEELAARRNPDVAQAIRLWRDEPFVDLFKLFVVADCPREEIASRLALTPELVAVAEELFFDVRPCLRAAGWVLARVVRPEVRAGNPRLATRLRLAYHGGPAVAYRLLDAEIGASGEEADRRRDGETLLHAKLHEALDAPFGSERERTEFLRTWLAHEREREAFALEAQRFAHQREQDRRQDELERLRIKTAAGESERAVAGAGGDGDTDPDETPGGEPVSTSTTDIGAATGRALGRERTVGAVPWPVERDSGDGLEVGAEPTELRAPWPGH